MSRLLDRAADRLFEKPADLLVALVFRERPFLVLALWRRIAR